jgi:D-lactate dehydrogenase (cytochrome)
VTTFGCSTGGTRAGIRLPPPDAVVYPRAPRRPSTSSRSAPAKRVPIIPFGAGTSLEGHVAALSGGISVDMREMDAIVRLSVDDLDVTVQAGVTRRGARRQAAARGRVLSRSIRARMRRSAGWRRPAPPGRRRCATALCATNVLSLTVVTAGGEVLRTGTRARKSSSGYDLTRLFVGSEGTLGLITELTLRVQPTPRRCRPPCARSSRSARRWTA